jgi:hypothetical protein
MSDTRQYISNCFSRIIRLDCSPQMHKTLCDDLADVICEAAIRGVQGGHAELMKLMEDAERGKYVTGKTTRFKQ